MSVVVATPYQYLDAAVNALDSLLYVPISAANKIRYLKKPYNRDAAYSIKDYLPYCWLQLSRVNPEKFTLCNRALIPVGLKNTDIISPSQHRACVCRTVSKLGEVRLALERSTSPVGRTMYLFYDDYNSPWSLHDSRRNAECLLARYIANRDALESTAIS